MSSSLQIRQKYKILAQLVKRLPNSKQNQGWEELRKSFRTPLQQGESLEDRLKKADERASFLRIVTPKDRPTNDSGRYVYRNGKLVNGSAVQRDANGRVVSNWDGSNLDPESVKRHNQQLRRAGFVNNAHAKGIF